MIAVLKNGVTEEQQASLCKWFEGMGLACHVSKGEFHTIIGLIGDVSRVDVEMLESLSIIERVTRISDPFKKVNRKFHEEPTVVDVKGVKIGGGNFQVIAGPCSVESEEQIIEVAKAVKAAGATLLRGGAFKPRTSPYSFQGLGVEGLKMLMAAKKETGLPIVTELMNFSQFEYFIDVDVIQIGARNMQNFDILKEVGHNTKKPILLKRGLSSTLQELLMSAEYIMASGNPNVILCERGIRTFETATRNTIDLSVVPLLHQFSHLPVVVDPSHATGVARLVHPVAVAATVIGADGLIIEVHNDPPRAKCDGAQSQTPQMFAETMKAIKAVRPFACK